MRENLGRGRFWEWDDDVELHQPDVYSDRSPKKSKKKRAPKRTIGFMTPKDLKRRTRHG
jgi:hypothetical protein